jgi:hypothetical protein
MGALASRCLLQAGEPAAPTLVAQLVLLISSFSGASGHLDCQDATWSPVFERKGLVLDPEARLAWASNRKEAARLVQGGKIVVCGNEEWADEGVAIIVLQEGGKPTYIVYQDRVRAGGFYVSYAVFKFARELR